MTSGFHCTTSQGPELRSQTELVLRRTVSVVRSATAAPRVHTAPLQPPHTSCFSDSGDDDGFRRRTLADLRCTDARIAGANHTQEQIKTDIQKWTGFQGGC
ncbi:hypothetical protein Q5P01_005473 [Channa striata]|uniref:Uncharacterized protein n=1 Tax=Channa striata TaxID=64152 RepID=A0AA88NCP3_CHASR|nr:hypothetical protein Q5P01_005473 [Channa striata]